MLKKVKLSIVIGTIVIVVVTGTLLGIFLSDKELDFEVRVSMNGYLIESPGHSIYYFELSIFFNSTQTAYEKGVKFESWFNGDINYEVLINRCSIVTYTSEVQYINITLFEGTQQLYFFEEYGPEYHQQAGFCRTEFFDVYETFSSNIRIEVFAEVE